MSEAQPPKQETPIEPDHQMVAQNPGLTLSDDRLAGNARCLNCGTGLQGPYCYYCGQPDRNFIRFFPALLRDLLEDFADFDSRFMRTMRPLLFHPGRLTRNFLEGRRFRYTPPLRLYIFASVAFFISATLLSQDFIVNGESETDGAAETSESVSDESDGGFTIETDDGEVIEIAGEGDDGDNIIMFNERPWDRETNPLLIPFMPTWFDNWLNGEIEKFPDKFKRIEQNPNILKDSVFDVLPITMFVLLPFAAFLFKFWYLFSKRYYVEHLIFALHNHAFIFVIFLILLLVESLGDFALARGVGGVHIAAEIASVGFGIWILLYFLFALKHVYQQGWIMTIFKYTAIGFSYLILLVPFILVVMFASLVKL